MSRTLDAVSRVFEGVTPLIDSLVTTEEDRMNAKIKLIELAHQSNIEQMKVNAQEATHDNVFVAGWRPFIGWVCGLALALAFIVFPIVHSVVVYYSAFTGENVDLSGLPEFNWDVLGPLMMGLLGLGAYRTYEKTKGVVRPK